MAKRFTYHEPGGGRSYDWANDNIFVKVNADDSGGAYALVEDNMKSSFVLGLHVHKEHAETFYIIDGAIEFHVDGEWITATPGACLHIPPGTPHAAKVADGHDGARALMIFQPAGFDRFLEELAGMAESDFADEAKMAALNAQYDIHPLGPYPQR